MMAHGSGSQPNKERASAAEIGAIGCERLLPQGNGGRCRSGVRRNNDGTRERLLPQETEAGAAERRGCCAVITGGRSFPFCRKTWAQRDHGAEQWRAGQACRET